MAIVYNAIYFLAFLIYIPIYLFKGKFHRGFFLRLGILPEGLALDRPVWVHAVSVGEVKAVRGLIAELRKAYPEKKFVISTVTPTGNKIAKGLSQKGDFVTYLPLDLSFIVRGVIDKINPSLFIIAETELWPNLVAYLFKKKVPIVVVNGRISDSSFKGYLSIKFLLKPILNKISFFCAQTKRDAERLVCLGAPQNRIGITGNMKFDILTEPKKNYSDYRLKLNLDSKAKLLVAGSTHPGEEEIILEAYKDLQIDFPALRLLIAPRHPERAKDIEKIVARNGFNCARISQIASLAAGQFNQQTIFVLDTIGELVSFYALADIVFVGGSLIRKGGHNILEPLAIGKPVLFGPYMFNFQDIAELFLRNQAGILVHNPEELKEKIKHLLNNSGQIATLIQQAKELILENQGATAKNLEYIKINWEKRATL